MFRTSTTHLEDHVQNEFRLHVNDIALPRGGKFDLEPSPNKPRPNWEWSPAYSAHGEHHIGVAADINPDRALRVITDFGQVPYAIRYIGKVAFSDQDRRMLRFLLESEGITIHREDDHWHVTKPRTRGAFK